MNNEIFQPAFDDLLATIQAMVKESKPSANPSLVLIQKTTPLDSTMTETGVVAVSSQTQYLQKEEWGRVSFQLFDKIKMSPQYENFRRKLSALDDKSHDEQLRSAVLKIFDMAFTGQQLNPPELLDYFLKSISCGPVPAWADIDIHGIFVKYTPNVAFDFDNKRFTFRQLIVADFEHETFIYNSPRLGQLPPNSILTIEIRTWRPYEFQIETSKMLTMLRLFQVCGVKFGRQAWKTTSPFAMIAGSTLNTETIYVSENTITFTRETFQKFEKFWVFVEPKLPAELRDLGNQKTTPISIALERYCDSLLTPYPIERKIAFAIMGLEAIYLGENEVQELMYRLQLRLSKILSKLHFNSIETRSYLKEGYKIRNSYVHGGHLSEREKTKLENRGIPVTKLANELLDYLRISILHLIISDQTKDKFLDLLEDSFIDRKRDEEFQVMMESETSILRIG